MLSQIVSAYESAPGGQETVDALARAFDLEPALVTTILSAHSTTFRVKQDMLDSGVGERDKEGNLTEHPVPDISDDQFDFIKQGIIAIGMNSGDERLRAKVGMWLWSEKKGRNDKQDINLTSVNINVINNHFTRLREAKALRRAALEDKIKLPATVEV